MTFRGYVAAGARTTVQGSAGYAAIERVRGTLQSRTGTFVLQHRGTMTRGAPHLTISVVPDSGTGELAGLAGQMAIRHRRSEALIRVRVPPASRPVSTRGGPSSGKRSGVRR